MLCQNAREYTVDRLPPSLVCESHQGHPYSDATTIVLESFHPDIDAPAFLEKVSTQAILGRPLSDVPHGEEVQAGLARMSSILDAILEDPVGDYRLYPSLFFDDVSTVPDQPGILPTRIENRQLTCVIAEFLGMTALADLLAIAKVLTETEAYYLNGAPKVVQTIIDRAAAYPNFRVTDGGANLIDQSRVRGDNLQKIRLMGKDGRRNIGSCDVLDAMMQSAILSIEPHSVVATLLPVTHPPQQARASRVMQFLLPEGYPQHCVKGYYDTDGQVQFIDVWSDDDRTWAAAHLIAKATKCPQAPRLLDLPPLTPQV